MKIGLASYEFRNNDVAFNLAQMERAMGSARGQVELLCFGEAFLQGFDALGWTYETDKDIAVQTDAQVMAQIGRMTLQYGVDVLFGYLERSGDAIYSSCAVMEKGKLLHNYRRISRGWKEYTRTDEHYREGTGTGAFLYHGRPVMPALCGDLWDFPERFGTEHLLIWPVYVNFDPDEWERYETEYARQACLAAPRALLVNPISREPRSYGGAFCFADGRVERKLAYDKEGILVVEV